MPQFTSGLVGRFQTVWNGVGGAPFYTTWWQKVDTAVAGNAVDTVADMLADESDLWTSQMTWVTGGSYQVLDIATGNVAGAGALPSVSGVGTGNPPMTPHRTQILVDLQTGFYSTGRQVRGRVFLPCPAAAQNDNGQLAAGTVSGLASRIQHMYDDTLGFNGSGAIYSRTHKVAANIEQVTVRRSFSSLRSR